MNLRLVFISGISENQRLKMSCFRSVASVKISGEISVSCISGGQGQLWR